MRRYQALATALLAAAAIAASLAACGGNDNPITTTLAATDLPETGLQGQVPIADQNSGRSANGYR